MLLSIIGTAAQRMAFGSKAACLVVQAAASLHFAAGRYLGP
jgi:hypothetical protein